MQTDDDQLEFKGANPPWYLIAEFLLSEVASGKSLAADQMNGSPFHAMQNLGIPPECIKRIVRTVVETAISARSNFKLDLPDLPVSICIYFNKNMPDSVHPPCAQRDCGWGYYVIERSRDFSNHHGQESQRVVEVYVYREGG